ncbi:Uncharacterized hydrolase [Saitozyma sp. JCM 24511]|nr:Uncharacterized hydrolase [Saitozyma sp. JCM 24511]
MSNFLRTGQPFFFLKPTSSYISPGEGPVELPKGTIVHHEVELGVVIGKNGRDIPKSEAESYIAGYALAVDMTARNVQDAVKKKGLPWTTAKGFDTFCPVGPFIPKSKIPDVAQVGLHFTINGSVKQSGTAKDMIFGVPELISFEGDLILTGTPAGVGPISDGETFEAKLTYPGLDGEVLDKYEFVCKTRGGGYEFKG